MAVIQIKELKSTLKDRIRELHQLSKEKEIGISIEGIAEEAVNSCDFSDYTFEDLAIQLSIKESESYFKSLSLPVPVNSKAESLQGQLFTGKWLEHGHIYDNKFVANRYANMTHNLRYIENVDSNANSVMEAQRREHQRLSMLAKAYASDSSVDNNELAVKWLQDND